ncbi:MAG: sigma-54-dependent Fis family transcriptional regulator [Polyangiaceae bacterium]|nr:sigma-54-dependent Fis family transcriptional regulator [Polyangiaceae bacterium]
MRPSILVVDDEPGLRDMLSILFRREGYDVTVAPGFNTARDALANAPTPYSILLTDLMMPDGSGLDLLSTARARNEGTEVVVMTAHSTVETALEAMRRGAYDFITKPFATAELRVLVQKALEKREITLENISLKAQVDRTKPTGLVGHSEAMKRLEELIVRIAPSRSTVLVTGESGTGKERIARAIHDASDRAQKPFLVVNCGAFPETLIEAELFGHEKGAFTGAVARRLGIFREAEGGTVFLDEIGELPLAMQVKLLRVIQEKKVRGVGESQESSIDVRIVAATNRNVEDEVKQGRFRQDLYYRLNVIRVEVPPLRDRREDLPDLLAHFTERASKEHGKEVRTFSPDARRALDNYAFPGNVRELENIVERAVALAATQLIGLGDLPREVSGSAAQPTPGLAELGDGCQLDDVLGELERRLIVQALERSGGVRTNAAKLLGVTFRSLRYRMEKLGMVQLTDEEEPASTSDPTSSARIVTPRSGK